MKLYVSETICYSKGVYTIFVNKNKDQLANMIKFNEKVISNWRVAYHFFRLEVAFRVFMLNTFKTCGSKSTCIFIIIDDMKNLIALANFAEFRLIENIFICSVSDATCLHFLSLCFEWACQDF